MKKIILIISALIFVSTMHAQFHFGPQIGYNATKLSTNISDISTDMQGGFLFGAFARFGEKIYVQPEVNWMTQGSVFKYPEVDLGGVDLSPFQQDIKLKSINIPVSLGWRIIDLKIVNIRLLGGVSASIITDKEINNSQDVSDIDDDLFKPITSSDISDLNWNYHFGAGVDVLMFALDVKYVGAFGQPINGDIKYNEETKSVSSSGNIFQVTLGWKIF